MRIGTRSRCLSQYHASVFEVTSNPSQSVEHGIQHASTATYTRAAISTSERRAVRDRLRHERKEIGHGAADVRHAGLLANRWPDANLAAASRTDVLSGRIRRIAFHVAGRSGELVWRQAKAVMGCCRCDCAHGQTISVMTSHLSNFVSSLDF
jgi:hypothetical protein